MKRSRFISIPRAAWYFMVVFAVEPGRPAAEEIGPANVEQLIQQLDDARFVKTQSGLQALDEIEDGRDTNR